MACLLLACIPVAVVLRLGLSVSDGTAVVMAVVAFVCVAAACIAFMSTTQQSVVGIRMGPMWILYFSVTFGLTSLAWVHQQGGSSRIIMRHSVPIAILGAAAGMFAVGCGYLAGPSQLARRATSRMIIRALPEGEWRLRVPSIPLIIYGIGLAARIYQIRLGNFGYLANAAGQVRASGPLAQPTALLQQFARYGLVLAALDAAGISRSWRAKLIFRVLLVIEILFGLYSGVKGDILLTLLGVAIAYIAGGRRIRATTIALTGAALLLVIPLNTAYRQYVRPSLSGGQTIGPGASLRALPGLVRSTYGSINVVRTIGTSVTFSASRLREIDNVALIIQKTPHPIPYQGTHKLLVSPFVDLVPRSLWPGKPVLATGYTFSQQYYDLPSTVYTSSAVTVPGDLYRYGGWPDLLVGMALLGALIRLFEDTTIPTTDIRRVLLYVPLFIVVTSVESDVVSQIVGLIQAFAILLVVCRFAFTTDTAVT